MKKVCLFIVRFLSFLLCDLQVINVPQVFANGTHSGQAISQAFRASGHASKSLGHSIAAGGQAVSAVAAVPFLAVGASGGVSTQIGHDLHDAAIAPVGEPLEITDEIITVGPPPDLAIEKDPVIKKDPVTVH